MAHIALQKVLCFISADYRFNTVVKRQGRMLFKVILQSEIDYYKAFIEGYYSAK